MNRFRNFALLATGLFALVVVSAACDSGTQEPAAPDQARTPLSAVDVEPDVIAPERYPKDLPAGVTAEIPANFPQDMPTYPGAVAGQGKGTEVDGAEMSIVQFMTNDSVGEVFEFYSQKLVSEGWVIEQRPELEGKNALSYSKGSCKGSLIVTPAEGGGSDIMMANEC